ncbi:MAG: hypothetical protein JJU20_13105 [Opitutales bacterium]|nr:hypothetical protein [Opitutales bacterium]
MEKQLEAVTQAPLPQMVEELGRAIANAQHSMDRSSVEIAQMMARNDEGYGVELSGEEGRRRSLLELGFSPTFYQITDATVEAKVSLTMGKSTKVSVGASVGAGYGIFSASVDASYSSKFSYDLSASSSIKAHFVAVPSPSALARLLQSESKDETED